MAYHYFDKNAPKIVLLKDGGWVRLQKQMILSVYGVKYNVVVEFSPPTKSGRYGRYIVGIATAPSKRFKLAITSPTEPSYKKIGELIADRYFGKTIILKGAR